MGSNHVVTYRTEYKTGGSWATFPGLLKIETFIETGGGAGPFTFGGITLPRATLTCGPAAPSSAWRRAPVRVYHTVAIDGASPVEELVFTGILLRRSPGEAGGWTFEAGGWDQRIARARVRTPLRYKRNLATRTTASSVENPATPGYKAGLLNEVFWRAGGRPYDQQVSYPTADWYYACDGTSVAPEWGWVDGENAWTEALNLAEAAGGQIYMDNLGVVRYINPLSLAEAVGGAPVIADTGPQAAGRVLYDGALLIDEDVESAYNVAACDFQRRAVQPRQEVYKARYPVPPLGPGESVTRELAMQWPCLWRDLTTGAALYTVTVTGQRTDNSPATPTVTVLTESAQVLEVRLTNPFGEPIQVASIAVEAPPLGVLEEGTARYVGPRFDANGGEDVERRLGDSIYTQNQAEAERRARLAVTFDGPPRPVYTVKGLPYVPGVHVGGYARLYSARYGLSDVPCRIIRRDVSESGREMSLALADVTGLPRLSELWVVGQAYANSDVRRMGL